MSGFSQTLTVISLSALKPQGLCQANPSSQFSVAGLLHGFMLCQPQAVFIGVHSSAGAWSSALVPKACSFLWLLFGTIFI